MRARGYLAGALALTGGALMLASGYSSRGFLYTALGYAEPRMAALLSGVYASAALLAITLLEGVIALGGVTVMAGGLGIVFRHTTAGRTLIWLGGGAGFLGLIVGFGYSAYRLGGLGPVLGYLPYWVGLALAIAGRRLAKRA
ncbi:MAG: hypothetical protein JRM74_02735 [Nitrososphaerota archaeon]|nr:hypothetical protein [Nitrososphaerota archaeon]